MKAIVCLRYGPPENLKLVEREKPSPKENEVLIRIYASAVTDSDIFIRSSKVQLSMFIPFRLMMGISKPRKEIPGEVFAGVIEKAGSRIKKFKVGDQVYGLTGMSLGAYADYMCMQEVDSKNGCIAIKPNNISFEEATAASYGGLLALQFLEKGNIQPKQKVLIYGASGTSGTIAVQYAKYLGADVTAVSSGKNVQLLNSLGAEKVINYQSDDSICQLELYDFILDSVGKRKTSKLKKASKKSLKAGGKYVSIDDEALILDSNRLNRIRELTEAKVITPIIDRCYPLEHIIYAHKYVELGHKKGGVAVTLLDCNINSKYAYASRYHINNIFRGYNQTSWRRDHF